jgi:hypothetical protein
MREWCVECFLCHLFLKYLHSRDQRRRKTDRGTTSFSFELEDRC